MTADGKTIIVGVLTETFPSERRVALIPDAIASLKKAGAEVHVEKGAGVEAGIPDESFADKGAVLSTRAKIIKDAAVLFQVRTFGANPEKGRDELDRLRSGQIVIGATESLGEPELSQELAKTGVTLFSLELLPRITRAQSMDILSSMATIAGYKGVLLAANTLPKIFPMFMTAAGTITPAKVFVVGAGVAGLQAIATAKRLGAVVSAYDIRPAVKEQVESLGGKFVELDIEAGGAEDKGGYAKAMDEAFYAKQRELMTKVVAESDVVITTAAIPGKKSPVLVTKEMVHAMAPGSIIVDLASERGGNCELTEPGKTIDVGGVKVSGPLNVPSTIPFHASQMYARNISTFFLNLIKDGVLTIDMEDEIVRDTLVAQGGEVVQPRVRELLGLTPIETAEGSK